MSAYIAWNISLCVDYFMRKRKKNFHLLPWFFFRQVKGSCYHFLVIFGYSSRSECLLSFFRSVFHPHRLDTTLRRSQSFSEWRRDAWRCLFPSPALECSSSWCKNNSHSASGVQYENDHGRSRRFVLPAWVYAITQSDWSTATEPRVFRRKWRCTRLSSGCHGFL